MLKLVTAGSFRQRSLLPRASRLNRVTKKNLFKRTIRSRFGHHQSAVRTQFLSSALRLKEAEKPRSTRAQSTGSSQYVAENYPVVKEDDRPDGGREISGSPNCPFLHNSTGGSY